MRAYEIEFAKAGTAHTPMIVLLPYFTTAGSLLAFLSGVLAATGKGDLDRRVVSRPVEKWTTCAG